MEANNPNQNNCPLPHYEDYETNILGCILKDGTLIDQVKAELNPRDFYTTSHQVIFRYMLDMDKQNIPIDELSLMEALREKGELEVVGGFSYLAYLRETATSDANIGYHIKKVKEAATRRHLLEKIEELKKAIEKNADKEVIRELQYQISIVETSTSLSIKPISIQELEDSPPVESLWGDILHQS